MAEEPQVGAEALPQPQDTPVERDPSAPEQIDPETDPAQVIPSDDRLIDLVALIADEFGISRSEARMMTALGIAEVVGDHENTPLPVVDHIYARYGDIAGKTIRIAADIRTVQFVYKD